MLGRDRSFETQGEVFDCRKNMLLPAHRVHAKWYMEPSDLCREGVDWASDIITKTLRNLTLVSKAIYPTASRLLWRNCLRVESIESLHLFRDFISRESVVTGRKPCEAYGFTKLFLAPFTLDLPVPGDEEDEEPFDLLAGQHNDHYCLEMEDHNTIEALTEVIVTLSPVLDAIIVDMPLRLINPELDDSRGTRRLLREGFEALVNVEEFVSINDELWPATTLPEVWTKWPKLKRLALYNVVTGPQLWKNLISCPQLEMVTLSAMNPPNVESWRQNIKDEWSRAWTQATLQTTMSFEDRVPYQGREVIIALCDLGVCLSRFAYFTDSWERLDPANRIGIMPVPVEQADPGGYLSQLNRDLSQSWIEQRALRAPYGMMYIQSVAIQS
ncbi:hypothetical protein FSHL1_000006 [Fusarium sambucinum]